MLQLNNSQRIDNPKGAAGSSSIENRSESAGSHEEEEKDGKIRRRARMALMLDEDYRALELELNSGSKKNVSPGAE